MNSNYDLSMTALTSPDGVSLEDNPSIRSKFQKAIGEQDIDSQLTELAKNPEVKKSLAQMEYDLMSGLKDRNPMKYKHNKMIRNIFRVARQRAWASLRNDPDVMQLTKARKLMKASEFNINRRPEKGRQQLQDAKKILELTNR